MLKHMQLQGIYMSVEAFGPSKNTKGPQCMIFDEAADMLPNHVV